MIRWKSGAAALLLALLMIYSRWATADTAAAFVQVPEEFHPGVRQTITCTLPENGSARLVVTDSSGNEVLVLNEQLTGSTFPWDGSGVPAGGYLLQLQSGLFSAVAEITVGAAVPAVELVSAADSASYAWSAQLLVSMDGILTAALNDGREVLRQKVTAGVCDVAWDCTADGVYVGTGKWEMNFCLLTDSGKSDVCSTELTIRAPRLATDETYYTPAEMTGVTCTHEVCYWKLNMGELDEEAIWQVLTQPITVVDGSERHQVKLRSEPSDSCTTWTGEVTCMSQAVHVLRQEGDWTLVQVYSSSVEGSSVAMYAKPCTGYIRTEKLKERQVSQKTGIVIDKLQQRLYVFREGKLYSTLLCSTGYSKTETPFNETPAGEFVCQSWTGGFWSGNLYCDLGIRINDGILLHEVPVLVTTDSEGNETRNYERCENYLGEKASHGCIRIQRKSTPEGVNMKWLWDNLSRGDSAPTKVIIWDEVGRTLAYPEDGVVLYYNPNGGKNYHSSAKCQGVKEKYWPKMKSFTYGELDNKPYSKLKACPYCAPQLTHSGVDTVNRKNTRTY